MACIRLNTITTDDLLSIKNGNVLITNTQSSLNCNNGALVVKGGVGIYGTSDATSSTSGGALTVNGGVGIKNQMFLGGDLILDSCLSTFTINGISYPRMFLDTITNKQFFLSLDGINQHLLLTNSKLELNVTQGSYSKTDAAVILNGGLSINTNINSSSVTCGGAITINGGGSVYGDFYVGESLIVSGGSVYTTSVQSVKSLELIANDDIYFAGTKTSINSDVFNVNNNSFILSSEALINIPVTCNEKVYMKHDVNMNNVIIDQNLTISNDLMLNGNLNISKGINFNGDGNCDIYNFKNYLVFNSKDGCIFESTSSSVSIYSGLLHLNDYSFLNDNYNLVISNDNHSSYINIHPNLDTIVDNVDNLICLYNKHDCFKIGYDATIKSNVLSIDKIYSEINSKISDSNLINYDVSDFCLRNNNGKLILRTDGSLYHSSYNKNTTSCLFNGSVDIDCDLNATSITQGGSLILRGGLSVVKDVYIGGEINLNSSTGKLNIKDEFNISCSQTKLNIYNENKKGDIKFSLFTVGGEVTDNDSESFVVQSKNDDNNDNNNNNNNNKRFSLGTLSSGEGDVRSIEIFTGDSKNQLFISTNGNIGINTNIPRYTLDVNGDMNSLNIFGKNLSLENDLNCLNIFSNDSKIANDLHVDRDILIKNDLTVDNNILCKNKLTVEDDVLLSKTMNISGDISCNSSGIFNKLVVLNTSSSALICHGGVIIECDDSITNGALSVTGQTLIEGNVNISKWCDINDSLNIRKNGGFNMYDEVNVLKFNLNIDDGNLNICRHDLNDKFIENVFTVINTSGSTVFNNTTPSVNYSTASVIMNGGLSINSTRNVVNISQGGGLTIAGGASISKNMMIGGNVTILSTSQSNNIGSGALVVNGGLGVMNNVNIGGNAIINGDLIIKGNTTNVDTENASIKDNIFVLNSGPSGSHDSGIIVQRYQTDNDKNKGDVANDDPYITDRLTSQLGISSPSNQIKLSYLTSNIDNYYVNWWIKVNTGFSINQIRQIISYDGTTHVATLSSPWTNQNPANGDLVYLYNKPYVGMIFNERLGLFEFGSTVQDPSSSNIIFTDNIGLMFNNGLCVNTSPSTTSSCGAFVLTQGGLSINCAEDAKGNTCGGSLTIAGGASINKSMYIGGDLYVNNVKMTPNATDILSSITYKAFNDQLDIPFINIDKSVLSFDIFLGVVVEMIDSMDNLYCNFTIRGVNKKLSWEIESTFMGEDTGIEFDIVIDNITSNGLIRYSTPDYGVNISNITFKYKMITN